MSLQFQVLWVCWRLNKCTGGEQDAILLEGTADRCVSLRANHRGGKLLNNGRAPFGGTKCFYIGVCGQKELLMSAIEWGKLLFGTQCMNSMVSGGQWAQDWDNLSAAVRKPETLPLLTGDLAESAQYGEMSLGWLENGLTWLSMKWVSGCQHEMTWSLLKSFLLKYISLCVFFNWCLKIYL